MQTALTQTKAKEKPETILALGIESSCDETAASVVALDRDGNVSVLSFIIASQDEAHAPFGGVVPEIAARAHMQKIEHIIAKALKKSGVTYPDLTLIAATAGPGLVGGVVTGLMTGKGLALSLGIPLVAVNHLEGHALSPMLSASCPFPYLLLLVSGGHTQLLSVNGLGEYKRFGSTLDDAAGEAFDKVAKIMGLGFPGGPELERIARTGNPESIALPRPLAGKSGADFSFSGLKTAAARAYAGFEKASGQNRADLAASVQAAITDVIRDRTANAMDMFCKAHEAPYRFVVAGGVAANTVIRESFKVLCARKNFTFFAPPLEYCTDNAAMIALAGATRYSAGTEDALDIAARPRWPLDVESAQKNPASGSGKKGPKS